MTQKTGAPLRIMLVEDDEDDRHFFKETVRELNIPHEITFATDCFQLFSLFEDGKDFDIIFLDINLPIMDGKECLKQIKADEKHKDIPVVIFSGSHAPADIDFVYEQGAQYYVVKPSAHINYLASLKIVLQTDWKMKQPRPSKEDFVVNFAFSN